MMNEHEETRQQELRESWIESLLMSATAPQDHADRIARAMDQIETEPQIPTSVNGKRHRSRYLQWGSIAVAASVLLALFLMVQNSASRTAMAAIQRSLNVAAERTARKYLMQIDYRSATGETISTESDLYVQGSDRFALRHPGLLPGTSVWLGQNGSDSWIVPALGPVIEGDQTVLGRWMNNRQELDTPYLHVTTMLTRMSRGYVLKSLDDEPITVPGEGTVECQHIHARRKSFVKNTKLPDTIELWASRESGMAIRLVAHWELEDGEPGRETSVLTFQNDEPTLSDDWFTAEGHLEGRRKRRRVNSSKI